MLFNCSDISNRVILHPFTTCNTSLKDGSSIDESSRVEGSCDLTAVGVQGTEVVLGDPLLSLVPLEATDGDVESLDFSVF